MSLKIGIFRLDDKGRPIIEPPPELLDEKGILREPGDLAIDLLRKVLIIDLNVKKGYRISPGVNPRAKKIGELARGKSLAERKRIFAGKY